MIVRHKGTGNAIESRDRGQLRARGSHRAGYAQGMHPVPRSNKRNAITPRATREAAAGGNRLGGHIRDIPRIWPLGNRPLSASLSIQLPPAPIGDGGESTVCWSGAPEGQECRDGSHCERAESNEPIPAISRRGQVDGCLTSGGYSSALGEGAFMRLILKWI